MAITLDITGVLQAAAFWVSNKGGSNGWKLFLYFYMMLTVLSVFLGNDPVILSGTAFLVYYTKVNEVSLLQPKQRLNKLALAQPHRMADVRIRCCQHS
jgi:Na+/H+ antiporter NhaD/arsenite permease-like protein